MTRNNHIKAQETLNFLNDHPAIGGFIFPALSLLELSIVEVCKRGYCKPQRGCISIYHNAKNYRRFKTEFDKEFDGYTEAELEQQKPLIRIDVPYKRLFGETWKADHVEYWGELPFLVFTGRDFRPYHDRKRWTTCCGVEGCGRNFEDMIVDLGRKFKRKFGNFDETDFLTSKEKANHKREELFFFKPLKDRSGSLMVTNPKYKRVELSELNRRWAKWFSKTAYCKQNWSSTVKDVLNGKEVRC
jgi:hypothetical protein